MNQHTGKSDWVISIHELTRRAGEQKQLQLELPAPADLGIQLMRVSQHSPIRLDLRLESVVEGVLASASVHAPTVGECARCLSQLEGPSDFELQELYFYPGRQSDQDDPLIVDEQIDLEPALRDAVVLELPFIPLCRPDCRGLCPACGANLNDEPDHRHDDQVDARWEKLKGLNLSEK